MSKVTNNRKLQVFLCHSSGDKALVRNLNQRLLADGLNPWLDESKLVPGQDWELEIRKAVKKSDIILVCLSESSINKRGFVQKEIKYALDMADEQPEGAIFLIPLKLEECDAPDRLGSRHWVEFFKPDGYERLMNALRVRAQELGLQVSPQFGGENLKKIIDVLAYLYDSSERARMVCAFAYIPGHLINWNQAAINFWHDIILVAKEQNKLETLIKQVVEQYGMNPKVRELLDIVVPKNPEESDKPAT